VSGLRRSAIGRHRWCAAFRSATMDAGEQAHSRMEAGMASAPWVGRTEETAALEELLGHVRSGHGGTLVVRGDRAHRLLLPAVPRSPAAVSWPPSTSR
jgi:hypothetical protein